MSIDKTAELQAQIDALKAEKAVLVAEKLEQTRSNFDMKVSEKGGVSVYGLGSRFPVTLYPAQWETVFANMSTIQDFLKANAKACETAQKIHRSQAKKQA